MTRTRFLADLMLMKLARWLRLAGQDVSNPPEDADDSDLIRIASREDRFLLTRDRTLAQRCKNAGVGCVLIHSSDLEGQLGEMSAWGLTLKIDPVRCTICNGDLVEVKDPKERGRVPHLDDDATLWRCESCGKLYWEGSHWKRIEDRLKKMSE